MLKFSQIKQLIFTSLLIDTTSCLYSQGNEKMEIMKPYLLIVKDKSEYSGSPFVNISYLKFLRISKMLC